MAGWRRFDIVALYTFSRCTISITCCSCRSAWACASSRNAADSSAGVFVVSTDQSDCRHDMIRLVSIGLVLHFLWRLVYAVQRERERAYQSRRPFRGLLGPAQVFRVKTRDFVGDATFRSKAFLENRRRAIILRAAMPQHTRFVRYYRRSVV